jgi:hypothetical protein
VEYAIALAVFAIAVALVVIGPLRREEREETAEDARREDLEAAKEAKYREIRDAELDHRMGKLSDADFRTTDRELRAQAIEILRELEDLDASAAESRQKLEAGALQIDDQARGRR